MEIKIKELIGVRCIIQDDGQKVYDAIHAPLKKGESVTLDFQGVHQFASPFFNYAIGQLLKDIDEEKLRGLLKVKNLDDAGRHIIKRVFDNAKQDKSDINYQKIVNDILEQKTKESEE